MIITVVVLYATISLSSEAVPVQSIAPTSYAQLVTQNEGLKSSLWSFSLLTSTSKADDFRLSYSKLEYQMEVIYEFCMIQKQIL